MGKQKASFEKLKAMLTQALMLIQPKPRKMYVVYNDAFYTGLRCVLMQGGKVVAYASRQLKLSLVDDGGLQVELQVKPTLVNKIKAKQPLDVKDDKTKDLGFNVNGILCFQGRYCVSNDKDLK
ncbi:Retrotransposable element Tf2 [Gossypium australe]|uniref:Retrotransposable element Tf2 n=1 Tax=Gossypium australe TaxID=47621 RepID=A0A5B6WGL1_9ROSI|nr:Retrotransposable element Tf2 [Gossypium australe]